LRFFKQFFLIFFIFTFFVIQFAKKVLVMRKISKLIDTLKEKFPDKIPHDKNITEREISFLQGQRTIIEYIIYYQKDLIQKEQGKK